MGEIWAKYGRELKRSWKYGHKKIAPKGKEMKRILIAVVIIILCTVSVSAHAGGTDGDGGHYDRSTGEYHYHHGYPAHQHPEGVCPYEQDEETAYLYDEIVRAKGDSSTKKKIDIEEVRKAKTYEDMKAKATTENDASKFHDYFAEKEAKKKKAKTTKIIGMCLVLFPSVFLYVLLPLGLSLLSAFRSLQDFIIRRRGNGKK